VERNLLLAYDPATREDDWSNPNPSGLNTKITPQEKIAAKRLILVLGHGTSKDNILK
jgi:hypothetical protein